MPPPPSPAPHLEARIATEANVASSNPYRIPANDTKRRDFEKALTGATIVAVHTEGYDEWDADLVAFTLDDGTEVVMRQWGIYCDDSGIELYVRESGGE